MAAPKLPQQYGPYTLQQLIARGGMAEIYRATMPGIGGFEKTVAIKKILPHLAENDEFITMLIDEARIIVSINHANIAQVYDLGIIDDDYYIAMEYIHGIDLSTIVKDLKESNRTVPVEHAVFIASGIAAGLHVAHNKCDETGRPINIVHRDVSPHNILISFAGDVKIIDFGVAKARGKEAHTQMGVIKGKLLYMAPEQAMAKDIDGRADLFAMGLILYRMLTNHLPFEGDNEFQIYNNILSKEITPPRAFNPSIPEEVNQIVMMLLHRDPSKRYQDGYSAKVDLDRALHAVAPGYSISRLSRWVEDEFTHLFQKRRRPPQKSGLNSAPATPSHNNVTGPQPAVDPYAAYDEINADEDTMNVAMDSPEAQALLQRAKEERARYAAERAAAGGNGQHHQQAPQQPGQWNAPAGSGMYPAPQGNAGQSGQFAQPNQSGQFAQPQHPQHPGQWAQPNQSGQFAQPQPQQSGQWAQPRPADQFGTAQQFGGAASSGQFPPAGQSSQFPIGAAAAPPPNPSGQFPVGQSGQFPAGQSGQFPTGAQRPLGSGIFPAQSGQFPVAGQPGQFASQTPSGQWAAQSPHVQPFQPNATGGVPLQVEPPAKKRSLAGPLIVLLVMAAVVGLLGWKLVAGGGLEEPKPMPEQPEPEKVEEPKAAEPVAEEPKADEPTEKVTIEIETEPSGASIFLGEDRLGEGPFTGEIAQSEEEVTFLVKLEGYQDKEVTIAPFSNVQRTVTLTPEVPADVAGADAGTDAGSEGASPAPEKEAAKEAPAKKKTRKKRRKPRKRRKKTTKKKSTDVPLLEFDASPKKTKPKTDVPVF